MSTSHDDAVRFAAGPLMFARGAAQTSRRDIGISVFAGMLMASTIGTLLSPMLHVVPERTGEWSGRRFASTALIDSFNGRLPAHARAALEEWRRDLRWLRRPSSDAEAKSSASLQTCHKRAPRRSITTF
jgi:hypothetical protein